LRLPGSRGGRAVKRLCVDRGIGPAERDRLPAIYADGRLAAVWRLGVHEEFLPVGENCRFIQITKEENEYEK
jgi:tRNA(Ile)-lysidine synthase